MNPRLTLPTLTRAAAWPLLLALCACGGAPDDAASGLPPPLFDAAGGVLPSAVPSGSRAAAASEEQLRWQELVSSPTTVVFDLDRLGAAGALAQAQTVLAFRPLPGTAWFVRGGAADDATRVADALLDQEIGPVFLVR